MGWVVLYFIIFFISYVLVCQMKFDDWMVAVQNFIFSALIEFMIVMVVFAIQSIKMNKYTGNEDFWQFVKSEELAKIDEDGYVVISMHSGHAYYRTVNNTFGEKTMPRIKFTEDGSATLTTLTAPVGNKFFLLPNYEIEVLEIPKEGLIYADRAEMKNAGR